MTSQFRNALPIVSVVLATHNAEFYIAEAVQSILNQSFSDFEFIIVDDSSTDLTLPLIKQVRDPRIKLILNKHQLGLTASLNIGIKHARGKYIARMDADDISERSRLKNQCDYLDKHPNVVFAGCWSKIIDQNGAVLDQITKDDNSDNLKKALLGKNQFVHGSVMMRKDNVIAIGGYDTNYTYSQDYDLWLRLMDSGSVGMVQKFGYRWRLNEQGISVKKRALQYKFSKLALDNYGRRKKGFLEIFPSKDMLVSNIEVSKAYRNWAMSYIYFGSYKQALIMSFQSVYSFPVYLHAWGTLITAFGFVILPRKITDKIKLYLRKFR